MNISRFYIKAHVMSFTDPFPDDMVRKVELQEDTKTEKKVSRAKHHHEIRGSSFIIAAWLRVA